MKWWGWVYFYLTRLDCCVTTHKNKWKHKFSSSDEPGLAFLAKKSSTVKEKIFWFFYLSKKDDSSLWYDFCVRTIISILNFYKNAFPHVHVYLIMYTPLAEIMKPSLISHSDTFKWNIDQFFAKHHYSIKLNRHVYYRAISGFTYYQKERISKIN